MTSLKDQTYWAIHLKGGMVLYTPDEAALEENEEGMCSVKGLDGEPYYFLREQVALMHRSTPAARKYFIELKVSVQEEARETQEKLLMAAMERQRAEAESMGIVQNSPPDHVGSAMDALRQTGPRPVD